MKKVLIAMLFIFLSLCTGTIYLYQSLWGPGVNNNQTYELYIRTGSSYNDVFSHLKQEGILKSPFLFDILAERMRYKKEKVKTGKYNILPKESLRGLLSKLRSGSQSATNITFNNIRTIYDLAGNIGKQIEADSINLINAFLDTKTLNKNELNPASIATLFIPNTYQIYWNTTAQDFVDRMADEHQKFWLSKDRENKAYVLGMTPTEISILASIVQKETNLKAEQPRIAGVYLNRLNRGMPLQADPTVVFAVGDFSIKRVLNKHLLYQSPYNTYLNTGLPPGPICIAESGTIDAVLNAEDHRYLYFCAKPGYDGGHLFAKNLIDHNENARTYQRWLSREGIMK